MEQDELLLGTFEDVSDFSYLTGDDIDALLDDSCTNTKQHLVLEVSIPPSYLPAASDLSGCSSSAKDTHSSVDNQQSLSMSSLCQPSSTTSSVSDSPTCISVSIHPPVVSYSTNSKCQATPTPVRKSRHQATSASVSKSPHQAPPTIDSKSLQVVKSSKSIPHSLSTSLLGSSEPLDLGTPYQNEHVVTSCPSMPTLSSHQCYSSASPSHDPPTSFIPDEISLGEGPLSLRSASPGPFYSLSPGPFTPGPLSPALPSGSYTSIPSETASSTAAPLNSQAVSTWSQLSLESASVPSKPSRSSPLKKLIRLTGSTRFSAVPGELKTVPLPALAQKRSKGTAMLRSSSVHPLAASAEPTLLLDVSKDERNTSARMQQHEYMNEISMPVRKRNCTSEMKNGPPLDIRHKEKGIFDFASTDHKGTLNSARWDYMYPHFKQEPPYSTLQRPTYQCVQQRPYSEIPKSIYAVGQYHAYPEMRTSHPYRGIKPEVTFHSRSHWATQNNLHIPEMPHWATQNNLHVPEMPHWSRSREEWSRSREECFADHQQLNQNMTTERRIEVRSKSEYELDSWCKPFSEERRVNFTSGNPATQDHVPLSRHVTFSLSHLK